MSLEILYQDDDVVVVNKTAGLLVHRSLIANDAREFALQMVRDQLGKSVYPVHRLDRPTSGALIFALSSEMAARLTRDFADQNVSKLYHAIVRGFPPEELFIDYPLKEEFDAKTDARVRDDKPAQAARTRVATLARIEIPLCVDKYPSTRYALIAARPETGRKHQIRRHLRHVNHPILGDVRHGSGKHNRFFRERFGVRRLLLACTEVRFRHPRTGEEIPVRAGLDAEFRAVLNQLGWGGHVH